MEEKGANVRRKSEKRKPPRARREKILNYRKWPRRPCCKSCGRRKGKERAEIRITTKEAGRGARAYAANEDEENPNLNLKCVHIHTHTHTHTLSSPRSRKGCLRKRGTRSHRCVHNNTQRHNNTDAESHSPNLIHHISFTELKFECRTRVAEGTSAGRSTLRHHRTHAPTGPRRARTYMRI